MQIARHAKHARQHHKRFKLAFVAAGFTLLFAQAVQAHVDLQYPTGGEILDVGSTVTILWDDVIPHGSANYDLWYSTSGANGPWQEIAADLLFPAGTAYFFDWTVPDTPSEHVRVRVRQDNSGPDYEDISGSDITIVAGIAGEKVVIAAAQDVTLYEGNGEVANGGGEYLFTGRTEAQNSALERRTMLAFEIANEIPAGSIIAEVILELTVSRTISGGQLVDLHRVQESWGEGSSDAPGQEGGGTTAELGDATWLHRMYPDTTWASVGGSFSQSPSASLQIDGVGEYVYSNSDEMVADVQGWLDDPSSNHGWALVMPSAAIGGAKRFNSRENNDASSSGPRLTVAYQPGVDAPAADFTFDPLTPNSGEQVSFLDESTGFPTVWLWDFGDGGTSAEQNPKHVFTTSGIFSVSLTAQNSNGSDHISVAITVLAEADPELNELVLVPAAANAEGSGGAFFITTTDVFNAGSATASFRFLWLPRNTSNASPLQSALFSLEPRHARRFHNLLAEVFGITGASGAVAVMSDSSAMEVETRTFNQTADGTFGQSLPGVKETDLVLAGTRVRVLFLTENSDFRTNLGLINGGNSPITLQWELFADDGTSLGLNEINLQAWGNVQLNRVLAPYAPIEAAYVEVWTMTSGGAFTCYGSVLDEVSSDPTTVLPR